MCCKHERRQKLYGDPLITAQPHRPRGSGHLNKALGYIEIMVNGVKKFQHRYVWEQAYGPIPAGYHIHHVNGIKTDNRIENLALLTESHHHRIHNKKIS